MEEGYVSPVWKIATGRRCSRPVAHDPSPSSSYSPDSLGNRLPTLSGHILFPRLIVGSERLHHCVSLPVPFSFFFF